jgi:adenylate cyclase
MATRSKLAVILHADVVGSTALVRKDESLAHDRIQAAFQLFVEALQRYGGTVHEIRGDALVAEFSRASDAVIAALAAQQQNAESNAEITDDVVPQIRVGIALGEVVIADQTLTGAGVILAQRIEQLAEPGGLCISAAVREAVPDRLALGYSDLGAQEAKGFDERVVAYGVSLKQGEVLPDPTLPIAEAGPKRSKWQWVAAIAVAVAIVGGGLWWWQPWIERVAPTRPDRIALPLPDKPSIAILPFANRSGDPQQEYFADGFTEDLITNVAQSRELFVIARNSTFTYKGRAVKIRQVAEELGVRYVLEGSVRRIGEKIRITAQLIDATDGTHVWAKRYDRPAAKIFDVQDEVSREIAGTLLANISKADLGKASLKRPNSLSAYDYVLRARAKYRVFRKDKVLEARALAEKAITIDPEYAPAYALLGDTFILAYILQWEDPESLVQAYDTARKAVEIDSLSSTSHALLGRVFLRRRQHNEAIAAVERSIALNPNRARPYAFLADALTFAGRAEEAVELLLKAMRLDPFYSPLYNLYLGRAYYFSQQYEKAAPQLKTCAARAPKFRGCNMYLIPTYAELGQQADAKREVEALLKIAPKFSIATSVQTHLPFVPSAMQFYISGLRKAGVPE